MQYATLYVLAALVGQPPVLDFNLANNALSYIIASAWTAGFARCGRSPCASLGEELDGLRGNALLWKFLDGAGSGVPC